MWKDRLKTRMKAAEKKGRLFISILSLSSILMVLTFVVISVIDAINSSTRSEKTENIIISVCLSALLIYLFCTLILPDLRELRLSDDKKYEYFKIQVIDKKIRIRRGGIYYYIIGEDIDTGEEITFEIPKDDMAHNKFYYVIRTKYSKAVIYEQFTLLSQEQ